MFSPNSRKTFYKIAHYKTLRTLISSETMQLIQHLSKTVSSHLMKDLLGLFLKMDLYKLASLQNTNYVVGKFEA